MIKRILIILIILNNYNNKIILIKILIILIIIDLESITSKVLSYNSSFNSWNRVSSILEK